MIPEYTIDYLYSLITNLEYMLYRAYCADFSQFLPDGFLLMGLVSMASPPVDTFAIQ